MPSTAQQTASPAQSGRLRGKVIVITGGNSGIGLATARLFKAEGAAAVVITASSAKSFAAAQRDLAADGFDVVQADVADLAQIDVLYEHVRAKHGGIDVLFANAGLFAVAPSEKVDAASYDALMNVNVRGLFFTVTKALPLLRDGSSVILNASVVAEKGFPGASVYAATKAAVRSFARTWTAEISPAKTRFNVLSPGPTVTPIFNGNGGDATVNHFASLTQIKRAATVEEIARVALFLASDDSSYVAGIDLLAAGGLGSV